MSPLLRGLKKRPRASLRAGPGTLGTGGIYAPEMSLWESLITCHTPSMPLPFVLNIGAPTYVYRG
jgi:hypothetical protein